MTPRDDLPRSPCRSSTSVTCAVAQVWLHPRDARQDLLRDGHGIGDGIQFLQHQSQAPPPPRHRSGRSITRRAIDACSASGGVALHVARSVRALRSNSPLFSSICRQDEIAPTIYKDAFRGQAVPPRAAGFLLIMLRRPRRAGMDHERTSDRSMPIPNATVATTMSAARRGTSPDSGSGRGPPARRDTEGAMAFRLQPLGERLDFLA